MMGKRTSKTGRLGLARSEFFLKRFHNISVMLISKTQFAGLWHQNPENYGQVKNRARNAKVILNEFTFRIKITFAIEVVRG